LQLNGHELVDESPELVIYCACGLTEDILSEHQKELQGISVPWKLWGCAGNFIKENVLTQETIDQELGGVIGFEKALESFNDQVDPYSESSVILIGEGCVNNCSYCNVKLAKSKLQSVPLESIYKRIEMYLAKGKSRITLVAEDVGSYGLDLGYDLSTLLLEIQSRFRCTLNIHAINPDMYLKHADTIKKLVDSGHITSIKMHIQSGSDRILKLMNRKYTLDELLKVWVSISGRIQSSSTIIYGFPTETVADLEKSVAAAHYFTHTVFIEYCPNPQTKAGKMEQLPETVVSSYGNALSEYIRTKSLQTWQVAKRKDMNKIVETNLYN